MEKLDKAIRELQDMRSDIGKMVHATDDNEQVIEAWGHVTRAILSLINAREGMK